MFCVKICGITTADDAALAAEAGADAIGLNFFPGSKRFVTVERAMDVARAAPAGVTKVGVFVNATRETIVATAGEVALDAVQLHGDEPPEAIGSLRDAGLSLPVVRAFRPSNDDVTPLQTYLAACEAADCLPSAALLDTCRPGEYGGTGVVADWSLAQALRQWLDPLPLILAGGLTPENVAEAIAAVGPHGVDTASGVESSPGRKDPQRTRAFVQAALAALAPCG